MICVYPADCTDFSTNGNGTIEPTSALVTETLNGEYELQLVHPIDDAGKWQRLVEGCILRVPVSMCMTQYKQAYERKTREYFAPLRFLNGQSRVIPICDR